jgi:hypothetical protein
MTDPTATALEQADSYRRQRDTLQLQLDALVRQLDALAVAGRLTGALTAWALGNEWDALYEVPALVAKATGIDPARIVLRLTAGQVVALEIRPDPPERDDVATVVLGQRADIATPGHLADPEPFIVRESDKIAYDCRGHR